MRVKSGYPQGPETRWLSARRTGPRSGRAPSRSERKVPRILRLSAAGTKHGEWFEKDRLEQRWEPGSNILWAERRGLAHPGCHVGSDRPCPSVWPTPEVDRSRRSLAGGCCQEGGRGHPLRAQGFPGRPAAPERRPLDPDARPRLDARTEGALGPSVRSLERRWPGEAEDVAGAKPAGAPRRQAPARSRRRRPGRRRRAVRRVAPPPPAPPNRTPPGRF